jgi:peptidoglycan/xylan/chitin deacetylase (PgdA/CDA1 family)
VILLLKSQYTLVELSFFENIESYRKNKGFCHITFDDGEKTFYTVAYPILKKHNVPATLFVSPKIAVNQENFWFQEIRNYNKKIMIDVISKELSIPLETINKLDFESILKCLPLDSIKKIITTYQKETNTQPKPCLNMNLEEILDVDKSGLVAIGAHTLNHPILKNESDENSYKEITESIAELEKLLEHKVKYFAYPNGSPAEDFGVREMNYLKQNNIAIAVSLESKFISANDNKLSFPRLGITYGSMRFVKLKLTFGANWEKLKSFLSPSKSKNRKEISLLLKIV